MRGASSSAIEADVLWWDVPCVWAPRERAGSVAAAGVAPASRAYEARGVAPPPRCVERRAMRRYPRQESNLGDRASDARLRSVGTRVWSPRQESNLGGRLRRPARDPSPRRARDRGVTRSTPSRGGPSVSEVLARGRGAVEEGRGLEPHTRDVPVHTAFEAGPAPTAGCPSRRLGTRPSRGSAAAEPFARGAGAPARARNAQRKAEDSHPTRTCRATRVPGELRAPRICLPSL